MELLNAEGIWAR